MCGKELVLWSSDLIIEDYRLRDKECLSIYISDIVESSKSFNPNGFSI